MDVSDVFYLYVSVQGRGKERKNSRQVSGAGSVLLTMKSGGGVGIRGKVWGARRAGRGSEGLNAPRSQRCSCECECEFWLAKFRPHQSVRPRPSRGPCKPLCACPCLGICQRVWRPLVAILYGIM